MAGTPTEHAGWVGSLGQPCRVWSARLPEISTSFQQLLILGQLCPCTGWPPPGSRKGLGQSSSAGPKVIDGDSSRGHKLSPWAELCLLSPPFPWQEGRFGRCRALRSPWSLHTLSESRPGWQLEDRGPRCPASFAATGPRVSL